ncbi:ALF repeat-containing protein [Streptomyces sp. NBC_01013]|uniref:ALF repeat-containing protein n=1 Tax=Streptomyces sp. NBC_01013 TaxID=2903718 RepID=UPI00386EAA5E|nr:ALF repeat-containing protein [Streptomyces sp. NBC_01013]
MRTTRAALLTAATALMPALLFTTPAFATDASARATSVTSTTPVTPTPATACPALPSGTGTGTPVDEMTEGELRAAIQGILADENAGKGVTREAEEALGGTVDDLRAFLKTGCRTAQAEDDTVTALRVLDAATRNGDKRVIREVNDLLDTRTPETLRAYLETGYARAQAEDDAVAVSRILFVATQSGDKRVIREANDALDAYTPEALSSFRWTGYRLAQAEDDSVYIVRMLANPDISDAMYDAIQVVLDDGSPEALRHFRTVGQYEIDG